MSQHGERSLGLAQTKKPVTNAKLGTSFERFADDVGVEKKHGRRLTQVRCRSADVPMARGLDLFQRLKERMIVGQPCGIVIRLTGTGRLNESGWRHEVVHGRPYLPQFFRGQAANLLQHTFGGRCHASQLSGEADHGKGAFTFVTD